MISPFAAALLLRKGTSTVLLGRCSLHTDLVALIFNLVSMVTALQKKERGPVTEQSVHRWLSGRSCVTHAGFVVASLVR